MHRSAAPSVPDRADRRWQGRGGQPAAAMSMATYAKQFFTADCRMASSAIIGDCRPKFTRATGRVITSKTEARVLKNTTGGNYWNGWGMAAVRTLDYIPLTPRMAASEACSGDVLVKL
ncbi:MAG: hypothetical protein R3F37_19435 [Candidatus Competibacteraceae bacterium]